MNQNNTSQIPLDTLTSKNHVKRILYATDLTKSAPKVYQYVLYLAKQFNAEIVCLHVIDKYSQNSAMNFAMHYLTKEARQEIVLREKNESLEEMALRNRQTFIRQQPGMKDGLYPAQLGLTITNKVLFGNVEEQISQHAVNSNCDLIVMGAHEKSHFSLRASISNRVMKQSRVPVTVVPIPGQREEQSTGFLPSNLTQFSAAQCK